MVAVGNRNELFNKTVCVSTKDRGVCCQTGGEGEVTEKLGKNGYFKMAALYPVCFDKLKQNETTRDELTNPY